MGGCVSTAARARAKSDLIDKQIEEDNKRYKRECKILVLGLYPPTFCIFPLPALVLRLFKTGWAVILPLFMQGCHRV